jgi:16S rRNA (guanine527-N7)-methyltransferase
MSARFLAVIARSEDFTSSTEGAFRGTVPADSKIVTRQSTIENRMDPAHIAELLAPFLKSSTPCHSDKSPSRKEESPALSAKQLQCISTYIDILLRWNARVNLTAIRDEEEIVTRHFGESLFAARHLLPEASNAEAAAREVCAEHRGRAALQGRVEDETDGALAPGVSSLEPMLGEAAEQRKRITVADVGSGAGFPGIPIKLWAPEISLTLVESNHKKATFLREVLRALTLTHVDIQNVRAESLRPRSFDLVTLRAVEHFETILPIASGLLAPSGRLALLIGSSQLAAAHAILPRLTWSEPVPIPESRSRALAVAENIER